MGKGKGRMSKGEKALGVAGHPLSRAVIAEVPVLGSILNDVMVGTRSRLADDRFKTFIDELKKTGKVPTPEQLHDNEFAHAVLETTRAAVNAHREEKIRRFARLLSNYDRIVLGSTIDDYEELLGILNELTDKEFQILLFLRKNEDDDLPNRKYTGGFPYHYWPHFEADAAGKGVPKNEMQGYLQRLARSGCVFMVGNPQSPIIARTTPTFRRLVDLVEPPGNKEKVPGA